MNDGVWLETFDHELASLGVAPADRAEARVEVESHLAESGLPAAEQFGLPARYAEAVAAAAGLDPDRRPPTLGLPEPVVMAAAVDGVSRSYRGRPALRPVSFQVAPGEIVAVTGPNGSGKSTLLRLLAGLDRPDTGRVLRPAAIGYQPQHGGLHPNLRPGEHFALFGAARGLNRNDARQEGERLAWELGWEVAGAPVAGELSGGTARKLSLIVALIGWPQLLLLDEPYQGLDEDSTRRFWELLWARCDQGTAAVVSSHDRDVLRRAATVIELSPARASARTDRGAGA